jgi:hypothetical protein
MPPRLGRLERVEVRDVWPREDTHFTPWLAGAENLALLGETIGLDLELEAEEKEVGPFRADILCRDVANDTWVLIENQIETTDHRHLGQILTYAAGLNAVVIVWIAHRFTDEHRAVLEWLNEISSDDISFFGLEIELWRIGNSEVAPKFNVVIKPNEWTKRAARGKEHGELSGTKQLQYEFWGAFREYVLSQNTFIKAPKPRAQHYANISVGRGGFHLSAFLHTSSNQVGVDLWIKGSEKQAHFELLFAEKEAIEAELGAHLKWWGLPDKKSSFIRIERKCPALSDRSTWPATMAELLKLVEAMHRVFSPRVKALDAEDYGDPAELENEEV